MQEDEYAQFIQFVRAAKLAEKARSSEPAPHGHAEQPVTPFNIQRQQQQKAWEQEQAQQAWEQQQAKQAWESQQQNEQALQQRWEPPPQQIKQQSVQPEAQQHQSGEWGGDKTQPAVQQTSQAVQQAPKQDEQRQERREEQQSQQQAVRPIPEGGAASGPSLIAAPPIAAPPITAPPIAAPPFTLPPIVAPRATASPITLPPINASPINASPINAPPLNAPLIAASSVQEAQTPAPAQDPAQDPRQPAPESDTTSQLSRLHLRENCLTPNVAYQAQRPFGIPALARAFLAGLPNYYDETAARWSQCQPARAKTIRDYDEDDYDDSDDHEHDHDATGTGAPRGPGALSGHQPPLPPSTPGSRGQKRTLHQQPVAGASSGATVVSRSHALHREREALDMMAAANTLTGGGRGLRGAADAQVVANDRVIRRRQEEIDWQLLRGAEGGAVEPVMKKRRVEDGGGGVTGAEARGCHGGTSAGAGA